MGRRPPSGITHLRVLAGHIGRISHAWRPIATGDKDAAKQERARMKAREENQRGDGARMRRTGDEIGGGN